MTAGSVRVACIQTNTGPDPSRNIRALEEPMRAAAEAGADLVTTPEMVGALVRGRRRAIETALPQDGHPVLDAFARWSRQFGMHILLGSMAIRLDEAEDKEAGAAGTRLANRSFLVGPDGIIAQYDKIHMFDVDLANDESYRESDTYRPGERAVLAATPWAPLGMTVCYDIRFPYLYRGLAKAGARMITVPSAFTRPTGQAHWHVLMRARAIETGCFIIAPAQTGEHEGGRQTFGHSLVVDPWGEVLLDMAEEPGMALVDLDLAAVDRARAMVPSLFHDRLYTPSHSAEGQV